MQTRATRVDNQPVRSLILKFLLASLPLLFLTACTPTPPNTPQQLSANDRAALAALYEATGGPNWNYNIYWQTSVPMEAWYGVTTNDDGRVISLTLAHTA